MAQMRQIPLKISRKVYTIENDVVVHELSDDQRTLESISTIQEETTISEETTVEMTQTTQPSQETLDTATTSVQSPLKQ
jgi:hypothetical protein